MVDTSNAAGAFVEEERSGGGELVAVATLLLAGAECPWRCLMCDLWKQTARGPTPPGALVRQIDAALASLSPARWLKLYNAGSFFDRAAVPPDDLPAIAARARRFERLIVECHPSLVGEGVLRFRDLLGATALEVAMGLETIHPDILPGLNKRMTPAGFARAASSLAGKGVDVRAFVLSALPFAGRDESILWAGRSAEFAFESGARTVTVIQTRTGNGALDALGRRGLFRPPDLRMLEEIAALGLGLASGRRGRFFVDIWDLPRAGACLACFEERRRRLELQNVRQAVLPRVACPACGPGG
jgi:radical SAM enzyme (TIGR01210 family)